MFTDPLAVTYNSTALSLPRTAVGKKHSRYNTADGEFTIYIADRQFQGGVSRVDIEFTRRLTDPTPSNVFDDYRDIRNTFGVSYGFDPQTRAEASVDIPRLRTALLSLVDTTFQGRLISGEK
jgi:uncharacterized protein (DUF2236 family)